MDNPRKVLLVEDNLMAQMGAQMQLEKLGFSVDLAETGQQAIELAGKNSYFIIFMDIGLPDMKGFEATKIIKKNCSHAFILALTAHEQDEEYQEAAKEAGLDGYLTKPITVELINKYLTQLDLTG